MFVACAALGFLICNPPPAKYQILKHNMNKFINKSFVKSMINFDGVTHQRDLVA